MHESVYTTDRYRPRYMAQRGPVRVGARRVRQDRAAHVRGWRGHVQEGAERVAHLVRAADDDPDREVKEDAFLWGVVAGLIPGTIACVLMASWMWDVYAHFAGLGWL
jgi:hypothetical protein